MRITKEEKIHAENLIKSLRRAEFSNFRVIDVLAFSDAIRWAASLIDEFEKAEKEQGKSVTEMIKAKAKAKKKKPIK